MSLGVIIQAFRSATGRLTLWYMAIVMAISLIFSFAVYRASAGELDSGLRRQARIYQALPRFRNLSPEAVPPSDPQLADAKSHIAFNLLLFNLVILVLAGGASYWLAKETLSPIEAALDAQSRFTADASHELRTPLTAMKTEIEVALRDSKLSSGDARQLLKSNLEEIAKLETLSNGLLKLAQGNGKPLTTQPCSLAEIVDAAVGRLQTVLKQRPVALDNQIQDVTIQGDRDSLLELVVILLDNAIKYSAPGSAVKLQTEVGQHWASLIVKDEGQGIKASDLPHIFDRFYRADRSRSKEQINGYGLGLSIAKTIAEAHGGKIQAQSTIGRGSTFTVKLPLVSS